MKQDHLHSLTDINFENAKPVYLIKENNEVEEAYILPRSLDKDPVQKHRDRLYLIFLSVGIISALLGSLISYKSLNGKK
jgi:hypothetical protein